MQQSIQEEEAISNTKDWKKRWQKKTEKYGLEFMLIAIMALACLTFFTGRHVNKTRAHEWLANVEPVLKAHFPKAENLEFEDETNSEF